MIDERPQSQTVSGAEQVADLKRLGQQIAQLNEAGATQRQRAESIKSPDLEANIRRCREVWATKGEPTLADMAYLSRTLRPDFDSALAMDYEALGHLGIDRAKWLSPLHDLAERAIFLFDSVSLQLNRSFAKIDLLSVETEAGNKHGGKLSDEILYEINSVFGIGDQIRSMHEKLEFLVGSILTTSKRLSGGRGPAEDGSPIGGSDVN
jgi:hypothetical protein